MGPTGRTRRPAARAGAPAAGGRGQIQGGVTEAMSKSPDGLAPGSRRADSSLRSRSPAATSVLAVLAVLYTLYFASDFLIPITAAFVLNLVLSPVPRFLAHYRISEPISAILIVPSFFALVFFGIYSLAEPAKEWMERVPQITRELQWKLEDIKEPVAQVKEVSENVEKVTDVSSEPSGETEVRVKPPSLLERLFGTLPEIGIQTGVTFILLFFLLASGEMFKEKLVRVMPSLEDKKQAIRIARQIERDVSGYLFTITMINAGLGVAIGLGLYVIGMPNALMWGVLAMLLNYVPYLGAACGIVAVAVAALISFDSYSQALIAPAIYVGANILESQFVTPTILGRRLTLNPVIIFISVGFWGWIWGVPGALMAVPLLIAFKVVCDHTERLAAIGEFLSGRRSPTP